MPASRDDLVSRQPRLRNRRDPGHDAAALCTGNAQRAEPPAPHVRHAGEHHRRHYGDVPRQKIKSLGVMMRAMVSMRNVIYTQREFPVDYCKVVSAYRLCRFGLAGSDERYKT